MKNIFAYLFATPGCSFSRMFPGGPLNLDTERGREREKEREREREREREKKKI